MSTSYDTDPAIGHSSSKSSIEEAAKQVIERDGEVVQSASGTLDAVYGVGGVGRTQRRLTARHVTFIGFGGGIGTGLFIGTGAALANAGPLGLFLWVWEISESWLKLSDLGLSRSLAVFFGV
jgi:amino acid transporter